MFAAQGLEFRRPLKSSKIIEENYEIIRAKGEKLENDRLIGEDILTIAEMVKIEHLKWRFKPANVWVLFLFYISFFLQ